MPAMRKLQRLPHIYVQHDSSFPSSWAPVCFIEREIGTCLLRLQSCVRYEIESEEQLDLDVACQRSEVVGERLKLVFSLEKTSDVASST